MKRFQDLHPPAWIPGLLVWGSQRPGAKHPQLGHLGLGRCERTVV